MQRLDSGIGPGRADGPTERAARGGSLQPIASVPRPEGRGFGVAVRRLRERTGISLRELARRAAVDPGYLHRIESEVTTGRPVVPRRVVVLALARGLILGEVERDGLLALAGYCPEAVYQLAGWDATLADVAGVLGDSLLDPSDKDQFRDTIHVLAARWRTANAPALRRSPRASDPA